MSGAIVDPAAGGYFAAPASVVAAADHWISAAAVRQAIGAWAYTLGAGERRPTGEAVRAAVGVACAIRELAGDPERWRWRQSGALRRGPLGKGSTAEDAQQVDPMTAVPVDPEELGSRAGIPRRDVESSLTLLASARVVTLQQGASGATVALSSSVTAPLPALAKVVWPRVRGRLEDVGASVAPALAVLRELVAGLGAIGDVTVGPEALPPLRMSVRELEDATGFGRSTVSEALAALERARLLAIEARAGRTTRFVVRPSVFGGPDEAPPAPVDQAEDRVGAGVGQGGGEAVPATTSRTLSPGTAPRSKVQGAVPSSVPPAASAGAPSASPSSGAAAAPVLIGTFAGTPIHAPPGTPLVVECDEEGRWTCRVGPFLRLVVDHGDHDGKAG